MTENEIAKLIVNAAYTIHQRLGPGLLETVYEVILARELRKTGLTVERQVPVKVRWDGLVFDEGFRADLVVGGLVIVELKSVEKLHPVATKQLLTYLKATDMKLGLVINFGERLFRDGVHRVVNGLEES